MNIVPIVIQRSGMGIEIHRISISMAIGPIHYMNVNDTDTILNLDVDNDAHENAWREHCNMPPSLSYVF